MKSGHAEQLTILPMGVNYTKCNLKGAEGSNSSASRITADPE
jgi:hypothetical protein